MGGRLILTVVQATIVLKGEYDERMVAGFLEDLAKGELAGWEIIDVFLDEKQIKDVEV